MLRSLVGLARGLHVISAGWVLILGFAIIADVLGRSVFSFPIRGTSEIIKNSVVAITFMQLPLAILSGSMLRTEIFADALPLIARRMLRTVGYLMGLTLFLLIAWSALEPAAYAFRIGEYEGEGALRVPTWPIRFLLIATAVYSAIAYLAMIWLDWTDQLEMEIAYPGILSYDAQNAATMTAEPTAAKDR